MSTYIAAEAALLALVRTYNGGAVFDEVNSSAEDWTALDATGTEVAAVVEMAGETVEADEIDDYGAHGEFVEQHQIGLWLCVKRGTGDGGDGETRAAVKALTEAVKDHIRPYERLNDAEGVLRAQIVRTSAPALISRSEEMEDATHDAQQVVFQILCSAPRNAVETAAA